MSKRNLALKVAAIANAVLLVALFVGCPARNRTDIMPGTISPVIGDFQRHVPPDVPKTDERFMPPAISPVIGDFQRHVSPPLRPKETPKADERFMPPAISPPTVDFQRLLPPGGDVPPAQPIPRDGQPDPR